MTYEDDQVKLAIPAGWIHTVTNQQLVLQKPGYSLTLAFEAGHPSGVTGGRFVEAFKIPWLSVEESMDCPIKLIPQPASRVFLFENILLDTSDSRVRRGCGIAKDLGGSTNTGQFMDSRRWFAGYFTTAAGGFMFDDDRRSGCLAKFYALTSAAETAEKLPTIEDPHLQSIIQESIDIVNTIQYKKCAPGSSRRIQ